MGYNTLESLFTYKKNLAWLYASYLYIFALSCYVYFTTFGKFSLLILAPIDFVSLLVTLPLLGYPYTSIPTPIFLLLFLHPSQLILKNLLKNSLFFH